MRVHCSTKPGTRTWDHRIKSQTGGLSTTTTAKRVQQNPTGNPLSFNALIDRCFTGDCWLELRLVEPECPTSVPRADSRTSEAVWTSGEFCGHAMAAPATTHRWLIEIPLLLSSSAPGAHHRVSGELAKTKQLPIREYASAPRTALSTTPAPSPTRGMARPRASSRWRIRHPERPGGL